MGKHVGSRLVQTVTAEDLADSMSAFNLSYHDSGLFGVYGVTDRWDMVSAQQSVPLTSCGGTCSSLT